MYFETGFTQYHLKMILRWSRGKERGKIHNLGGLKKMCYLEQNRHLSPALNK